MMRLSTDCAALNADASGTRAYLRTGHAVTLAANAPASATLEFGDAAGALLRTFTGTADDGVVTWALSVADVIALAGATSVRVVDGDRLLAVGPVYWRDQWRAGECSTWTSNVDANVWAPGVYGWTKQD